MLSFAGDQFAQVAIAILVYGRTHSPFLTALAYALTYLPPIAGGPLISGLYAVQGPGILADGAMAQLVGAPLAVALAGLVGLTTATMLAMSWTHLRTRLIQTQHTEATTAGA